MPAEPTIVRDKVLSGSLSLAIKFAKILQKCLAMLLKARGWDRNLWDYPIALDIKIRLWKPLLGLFSLRNIFTERFSLQGHE